MLKVERAEFARLFREFVSSYPSEPDGVRYVHAYEENRRQSRQNLQAIREAADRGEDVTDLVLLKLLPHTDGSGNRDRGAWVHIAPAIQENIKGWLERRGWWTNAEHLPRVAE